MTLTIVRYRVKPDRVEENAELVRAVYAELAAKPSPGFRYTTFVEDDGVTFVHVAMLDEGHEVPLPQFDAFKRFLDGIGERCDEPPHSTTLRRQVGAYGL